MTEENDRPQTLAQCINALEETYEFMLGYAAQGRDGDEEGPDPEIRRYLEKAVLALDGLDRVATEAVGEKDGDQAIFRPFIQVLADDAAKAGTALNMVAAQPVISSALIDNLNASAHLRALLTDLFLIDEALGGDASAGEEA